MRQYTFMIKPASSLCNMRCTYCFYHDVSSLRDVKNYGIMKREIAHEIIDNIYKNIERNAHVTFAFQGGEPSLAGLDFFVDFAKKVRLLDPNASFSIQTNGLLINENWCKFFKKFNFLVGLSFEPFHDINRLDWQKKSTFERILETKRSLDFYEIDYNILCVLTNTMAKSCEEVWNFLMKYEIDYVQFIPCLNCLEEDSTKIDSLTPDRFFSFYTFMLENWSDYVFKGNFLSVKFIDDLFNLLVHRQITACGFCGDCQPQLIIEADGTTFPCDFYATDEFICGNLRYDSLENIFHSINMKHHLNNKPKLPSICKECQYLRLCGGGCKRMFNNMYVSKNLNYCGYQHFLSHNTSLINKIIGYLKTR